MKNYRTSWDLSLLYKSINDPQIEKDLVKIEKVCSTIEKRYKDKRFIKTPQLLFDALEYVEKISSTISESKPLLYLYLSTEINTDDDTARARLNSCEHRLSKAENKLVFFDLAIASIPKEKQKRYLSYPSLKKYRYMLEKIFLSAKYMLSEKEEQIITLLGQPSFSMWVDANEKFLNKQTVVHDGVSIPLSKAEDIVKSLSKKKRDVLYEEIKKAYRSCVPIAEPEINAIVTQKKILDELRGYKDPTSSSLLSQELDSKTVDALLGAVKKFKPIIHKFYSLHAKLLGQNTLSYVDRQVSIGQLQHSFTFERGIELVGEAFSKAGNIYPKILSSFLEKGQVDVFPREKKRGGGYCLGTSGNPTFILLNHTDDLHSVETLAHEMGHAFHWYFSSEQPEHYRHHTTTTAEVASTFFEQVLSDHIVSLLSPKERITYLHSKILSSISTIFRQVAFFNFEKELHERIRKEGYLSSLEIQKLLMDHMRTYLGPLFRLSEDDGLQYISWSHLRMKFYTISYAYGLLVSKGLYANWKKDKTFIKKVELFMKAGGSSSPKDIFKKAGIDTTKKEFFESGLKQIEKDIALLARLSGEQGLL